MRFTVTKTAPADIYGKSVKEGDELSLSKLEAAHHLRKGHIVPAAKAKDDDVKVEVAAEQFGSVGPLVTVESDATFDQPAKARGKRN